MVDSLNGRVSLIMGANGGIGRATAFAMAKAGAQICISSRDPDRLSNVAAEIREMGCPAPLSIPADMTRDEDLAHLKERVGRQYGEIDILVNCAGSYIRASIGNGSIADFDRLYATNLRGPYQLIRNLLPLMHEGQGDIVFVSSTQGLAASGKEIGPYAATHHGLRAIANTLREEINALGIRVTLLHIGTTATPLQEKIYASLGRAYHPNRLLQPDDIGAMVVAAVSLPRTAEVTEITIRPSQKP